MMESERVKRVLAALSVILLIGCSNLGQRPLITKVPGDRREFEIVKVDYSARQGAAAITFSSSFGIFAFDLDLGGRKVNKLTFIVHNQRYCEGLNFQDRNRRATDLRRAKGVQVRRQGSDMVIEITPPALDLLKEGGRVQYVNQYR